MKSMLSFLAGALFLSSPARADLEELNRYEQTRILGLSADKSCADFEPHEGIFVTQRDASGNATAGRIRVLVDHPGLEIYVVGPFNEWGAKKSPADRLHQVGNTPYYEGQLNKLSHGMEYRFLVNGASLFDPAAAVFTPAPAPLNSVFWDFDRPDAYHPTAAVVDLRDKPLLIAEAEVLSLAQKWPTSDGQTGPRQIGETYRFIAESGLAAELARSGYNALELMPIAASNDSGTWQFRYQVYGNFAVDARYGTPDEFAQMVDAFNREGVAVILDSILGHYPKEGNGGLRELAGSGLTRWLKADGGALFGGLGTDWGTRRYDFANPFVRTFLADSATSLVCHYPIGGLRLDNLDGIRLYEGPGGGGPEFIHELSSAIRSYRPQAVIIGEMFTRFPSVLERLDQGGLGIGFRNHGDLFDFFKENLQRPTERVDMAWLASTFTNPWAWGEAPRLQYVTNHDEAANSRGGATGAYLASLIGGGRYYQEHKTKAFASMAMLSGTAYIDMLQMRLVQEGSFNDNAAVDWSLRAQHSDVYRYFAALSNLIKDDNAFAFPAFRSDLINHLDGQGRNRVISLRRHIDNREVLAVINLGHQTLDWYRFGLDAGGNYKVKLNSDARDFGGSGQLEERLHGSAIGTKSGWFFGKPQSITLPHLAPYGVVILERS